MTDDTLIPFLAVFTAASLGFLAVWYFISSVLIPRRRFMDRRLSGLSNPDLPLPGSGILIGEEGTSWRRRLDQRFENLIARTGLDIGAPMALALILFCGVVPAALLFVWRYEEEPWLALPAFLLGVLVPLVFFIWRQGVWRRTLQEQLPDTLFLLARSLRAGRSIDQAVQLAGEQGVPPLAREFARMHRQMELGLHIGQVFANAAARIGLTDFDVLASVIGLHRATGGNLAVLLDRQAAATRDHNHFEGQYRAATVLGRYSAAFIAAVALGILLYLFFFQREWALRFFESPTGLLLFGLAMALEVCGLLLLCWLLRHDH